MSVAVRSLIPCPVSTTTDVVWKPFYYNQSDMKELPQNLGASFIHTINRPLNNWHSHPKFDSVVDGWMQKLLPGFQGLVSASVGYWIQALMNTEFNKPPSNYMEVGGGYGGHLVELLLSNLIDTKTSTFDIVDNYVCKLSTEAREDYVLTLRYNLQLTKKPLKNIMVHYVNDYTTFIENKILTMSKGLIFVNGMAHENQMVNVLSVCWLKLAKQGIMVICCSDRDTMKATKAASHTFLRMIRMYPESIQRYGRVDIPNSAGCIYFIWKA